MFKKLLDRIRPQQQDDPNQVFAEYQEEISNTLETNTEATDPQMQIDILTLWGLCKNDPIAKDASIVSLGVFSRLQAMVVKTYVDEMCNLGNKIDEHLRFDLEATDKERAERFLQFFNEFLIGVNTEIPRIVQTQQPIRLQRRITDEFYEIA